MCGIAGLFSLDGRRTADPGTRPSVGSAGQTEVRTRVVAAG